MAFSVVDDIIKTPFLTQNFRNRVLIMKQDKPRPSIAIRVTDPEASLESRVTYFSVTEYDRVDWLTACEKRRTLFCWPCLLFGDSNIWNTCGVDGSRLKSRIVNHEIDEKHIEAKVKMQLYMKEINFKNIFDDTLYNSLVERNREIMKRIIDTVCFVILRREAPSKEYQASNQLTVNECVEAIQFLSAHGSSDDDRYIIEDAIVLLKESKALLNNIVDSMYLLMKLTIKKEALSSAFVSVILSGHGEINPSCVRRSAVLRYLKNGKVCERFVGFYQNGDSNCEEFFKSLNSIVNEFQLAQRVLSLSVDGTFPDTILEGIRSELPSTYPYATFVPCHFHKFRSILQQRLSMKASKNNRQNLDKILPFFKMMESLVGFLEKNYDDFKQFLKDEQMKFTLGAINTPVILTSIKFQRKNLIEYFSAKIQNCDKWKIAVCMKAYSFREFLTEFTTVFWLEFFIRLFILTEGFSQILEGSNPELLFEKKPLDKLLVSLIGEKETGFEHFWNGIIDYLGTDMTEQIRNVDKIQCYNQYLEALDCVISQVKRRLMHLTALDFFNLLNPQKFIPNFYVPNLWLNQVADMYGSTFGTAMMKQELQELYVKNSSVLGYSVEHLLDFMNRYQARRKRFAYMVKLAELVLTMPCRKTTNSHSSIIDKINVFSSSYSKYSGDASALLIQKELLQELRQKKGFHAEVISGFAKLNNGFDMLFSNSSILKFN